MLKYKRSYFFYFVYMVTRLEARKAAGMEEFRANLSEELQSWLWIRAHYQATALPSKSNAVYRRLSLRIDPYLWLGEFEKEKIKATFDEILKNWTTDELAELDRLLQLPDNSIESQDKARAWVLWALRVFIVKRAAVNQSSVLVWDQ
jgi:hypothetical protein